MGMRGEGRLAGALVALVSLVAPAAAAAAPGDLDPAFGAAGKSVIALPGSQFVGGLALQADGSIIVGGAGHPSSPDADFMAMRLLNPSGVLDASFGPSGTGVAYADLGSNEHGNAMLLQPDGRILLGGDSDPNGTSDFAVVRLTPGGLLDTSYGLGTGGSLAGYGAEQEFGSDLAMQPDGRILISGQTGTSPRDLGVVRLLNPEGTFDTSFGGGSAGSFPDLGADERGGDIDLQPDGKIVLAGTTNYPDSSSDLVVTRLLNPQGTTDPGFGDGTKTVVDFGGEARASLTSSCSPTGRSSSLAPATPPGPRTSPWRGCSPTAPPDPSFAGGRVLIDFGGEDDAGAMAVQPNGKIVLVGRSQIPMAGTDTAVARLLPDGSLDGGFAQVGRARVDIAGSDEGEEVVLAPDGDILVASQLSSGNYDVGLARFEGDPPPVNRPVIKCAGRRATIVGTGKANRLKGTKRADVIAGLGGNDKILGFRGKDIICGGPGRDILFGGPGKDRLLGQAGRDRLRGGKGRDRLQGGPGKDNQKQ